MGKDTTTGGGGDLRSPDKKFNFILYVLGGSLLLAVLVGFWLINVYTSAFNDNVPSVPSVSTFWMAIPPANANRSDWGAMGDFFGGMLNPFFSLLGLVMLLVTLFQNQRELELSREELRESTKALKEQASTLDKQRFEDSFFALLSQVNATLERVLTEKVRYNADGIPSQTNSTVDVLTAELIGTLHYRNFTDVNTMSAAKQALLKQDPFLNQYFRMLYQVLKLIAKSSPGTLRKSDDWISDLESSTASSTEKFYSNIVRSLIPQDVGYLLAINCFAEEREDQYFPYKLLVERYSLLEHLPLVIPKPKNEKLVLQIARYFKAVAFGKSIDYKFLSGTDSLVAPELPH